ETTSNVGMAFPSVGLARTCHSSDPRDSGAAAKMSNQVQVRVQVAPRWQVLAGHACGIGQRAMLGELAIDLPGRFDFTALDAAMAAYVDDPLPRQPPADAAVAFARRLLHWSTAVQRRHRVPVFGSGLAWRGGARAQRGGGQVV